MTIRADAVTYIEIINFAKTQKIVFRLRIYLNFTFCPNVNNVSYGVRTKW